jgi:hypothetical protein
LLLAAARMGVVPGGLLGAEASGDLLLGLRPGAGAVRAGVSAGRTGTEHVVLAVAQVLRR